MRSLLLFVLTLALTSSTTLAQMPVTSSSHVIGGEVGRSRDVFKLTPRQPLFQPSSETLKLSYFDANLPTFDWVAPAIYGDYVLLDLGQRFTLPTASGFVDSVRIYFDTAWGARLGISLYADSLYDTGLGEFHLMNDFTNPEPYGSAIIEAESILPESWVTIDMGHAAVPKEFFVRVSPENDGVDYIAWYALRTEQEPVRARTAENSRSAFFGVVGQNYTTAILDSTFLSLETEEILIGDFWIEAFVSFDNSSVAEPSTASFRLFPNPVAHNAVLNVQDQTPVTRVQIFNTLGVQVMEHTGRDTRFELPTQGLTPGIYHVIVTNEHGSTSQKLIVN